MQIFIDIPPAEVAETISLFVGRTFIPDDDCDCDCGDCEDKTADDKPQANISKIDVDSPQGKLLIALLENLTSQSSKLS